MSAGRSCPLRRRPSLAYWRFSHDVLQELCIKNADLFIMPYAQWPRAHVAKPTQGVDNYCQITGVAQYNTVLSC